MSKSNILKSIALAAGLTAASLAHAAPSGDIWEIRPCTSEGVSRSPYATIDTPLTSGEPVYFNIRLVKRSASDSSIWRLAPPIGLQEDVALALSPMQIGIYVSGKLTYAEMVGWTTNSLGFTDLIFTYKTKPGDFALPIVLAMNSGNQLQPAYDAEPDSGQTYYSYYVKPVGMVKWDIVNDDGDTCNLWYRDSPPQPMMSPDGERIKDFSLAKCGFYVKTIDFDSAWESTEEGAELWRSVHEKSSITVGKTPSLEAKAPVEEAITLYVWSDDETAVRIKGGTKREIQLSTAAGDTITTTVGEVTLSGGQVSANFQIEGVSQTGGLEGDGRANLVLTSWTNYTYSAETGERNLDYIMVPVKCIEALPVSIVVERDDAAVIAPTAADEAYLTAVTRLSVYATQAPTNDVTVTIQPSFQIDPAKTDWGEYLRFSTSDSIESLPTATLPTVVLEKGKEERKYIYVYALRSEKAYTIGMGKQIQFTLNVDPAEMEAAGIKSLGDPTGIYIDANAPIITSPLAETILPPASAGQDYPLDIAINDTFADMSDKDTGYTVSITFNGTEQKQETTFIPDGDGYTLVGKDNDALKPSIHIPATLKGGDYMVSIKVTSPIRKLTSAVTTLQLTVMPAKSSKAETTDAETDYVEGDIVHYKVTMSDAPGEVVYAFLVNYDDAQAGTFGGAGAKAILRQADLGSAVSTSKGVRINADGTTATGNFVLQDGASAASGGSTYQFGVVFSRSQVWNPTADMIVDGFPTTEGITITVYNKEPQFVTEGGESAFVEGNPIANGAMLENEYPKGQQLTIAPNIYDVDFDLKHGFKYKYTISRGGKPVKTGTVGHEDTDAWAPGADTTVADGTDINKSSFDYDFPIAGVYTVKIQLQDKDMRDEGENKYASDVLTFSINIIDQPQVSIDGEDGRDTFFENELRQHIMTGLSFFPDSGETMVVKVTVTPPTGDNPGILRLSDEYKTVPAGYPALADNEYYVSFTSGAAQGLLIEEMDGTLLGATKGFTIKGEVMNTTESLEPGTAWKDYFRPYTKKIYIDNIAPETTNVTEPGTNAWVVAGGLATSRPIKFAIKNDVAADLNGITGFPGIKVTITGCESGELTPAMTSHANPMEFYIGPDEPRAYTFTPNFGSVQGEQTITLTITDKDQGEQSWTYLYRVTPSKFLHTLANGPSGGTTTSPLSQKYTLAEGIGMGHTFVDGAIFAGGKNFRLSWNCSKDIYKDIYAFGYKVNNPDDDGTLDGMDIAISTTGAAPFTGASYHYPPADGEGDERKDSYFYCWLLHAQGEQGGVTSSVLGNTIAPERHGVVGRGQVTLPTEQTEDGSYIDTLVEAVFAKEWLVADNLGDINQDGVPDAFAVKTWKGGKLIPLVAGVQDDTEADLIDLGGSNPDEDLLPGVYADVKKSYAPVGRPFTTRLEVRGFDTGLNARDVGHSDVSFSEDEQKAYTAATGLAYDPATVDLQTWSPEPRGNMPRMDPTLEDTDGDGFPDGWEYYFWYMAHVWTPAQATIATPLTGQRAQFERFNMAEILVGTPIDLAEVERRFNPCSAIPADERAKDPDFDKDGLSDLEELVLGTNPAHWDSDGDHMCDGWEVMMSLDPLDVDRVTNEDGDFMASHAMTGDFVWIDPDGDADPYAEGAVLHGIVDQLTMGVDYDFDNVTLRDLTVRTYRCSPKWVNEAPLMYGIDTVYINETPPPEWSMYMVENLMRETITIPAGSQLVRGLNFVLVHDQVLRAFDFDPRTGWFKTQNGFVADRWDPTVNNALSGYDSSGRAVDTRAYCTFDEYLVMRYRYNYGITYGNERQGFEADKPWQTLIGKTTNPSVVHPSSGTDDADAADGEVAADDATGDDATAEEGGEGTTRADISNALANALAASGSTKRPVNTHGADTDQDGIPDGWELYTYRNPNGQPESMEDGLGGALDYDGDGLAYVYEYAGTDSCNAYSGCKTIFQNHPGTRKGWFNKFFPTNPGTNFANIPDGGLNTIGNSDGADTDGDGVLDALEGGVWTGPFFYEGRMYVCAQGFIYGDPEDSLTCCVRGGGMNPCTIDTDLDGLPDPWELANSGIPVDLATLAPVLPRGGDVTPDLEISQCTRIADGLQEGGTGVYIMGGMDATWDGDNVTDWHRGTSSLSWDPVIGAARDVDFDHDGLQNYQEYLVQSIRHFRYDDITTPLMGRLLTEGTYEMGTGRLLTPHTQEFLGYVPFDASSPQTFAARAAAIWQDQALVDARAETQGFHQHTWDDDGWRTLGYLASPRHTWDRALTADKIGSPLYQYSIIGTVGANIGYVSTDPRIADTDGDGMDDYYELFHGLNPILGTSSDKPAQSPQLSTGKSGDIISATYRESAGGDSRVTFNAFWNEWTHPDYNHRLALRGLPPTGRTGQDPAAGQNTVDGTSRAAALTGCEALDPVLYPWTMGSPSADSDGDGMRNEDERVATNMTDPMPRHTDPTPRWFTERTTAASYTRQYYVAPSALMGLPFFPPPAGDDYAVAAAMGGSNFAYVYAFEENEGYDTDNDFAPDGHEIVQGVSKVSDPQRHDDPVRRQALYLNGVNSYVMSRDQHIRPVESADLFKQFTVECWVMPERTGVAQTVLERSAAYTADANNKDHLAIRANFRIGIAEDGRAYGLIDNSDAIESGENAPVSCQRLDSLDALPLNEWTHLALTYDGQVLKFFVNGHRDSYAATTLIPANGASRVTQTVTAANTNAFAVTSYDAVPVAFFIGARPQKEAYMALTPSHVENGVHDESFANVREFFKGYVDEVRVWDGARTEEEIAANYDKAMTYDEIAANRLDVFMVWRKKGTRNSNDGRPTLPPELVMHYDFTTLPGALNAVDVAQAPVGYTKMTLGQANFGYTGDEVSTAGLYANILELKGGAQGETADDALAVGWWNDCLQKSRVYKDYTVVPWIANTVARLPALDGAAVDSEYYGERLSGALASPTSFGLQKFTFPNTGLPYQGYVYNMERVNHLNRVKRAAEGLGMDDNLRQMAEFQIRNNFLGTSELIPLGGAYAKICSKMWDGAPSDLWEYTGTDEDADGLPDWWEAYAKAQGYYTGDDLSWDTEVTYNGRKMSAAKAYRIDRDKGVIPVNGVAKLDSTYQSSMDTDADLIPDWWERLYDVEEYGALDDPDGDGLCNYIEFLLSVAFDVGAKFDPLNAYSVSRTEPDYFFPIGNLYAGEIFTDHDMMRDQLEDEWGNPFASRLAWDQLKDVDEDGWSNFAEASYNDFTARTLGNNISHINGENEMKDMPIPTLKLTLRYNDSQPLNAGAQESSGADAGQNQENNGLAPIVVQTFTRAGAVVPDAVFNVEPGVAVDRIVDLGGWVAGSVRGTLSPGYVQVNDIKLQVRKTAAETLYLWQIQAGGGYFGTGEVVGSTQGGILVRGTYTQYLFDYEWYGPERTSLIDSLTTWEDIPSFMVSLQQNSQKGHMSLGAEYIGTVDMQSGAFDLNLNALAGHAFGNSSNTTYTAEQAQFRFAYKSQVPKLQSNRLELFLGDPNTGYVKEGPNVIVAFYDLDNDGKYTAGEPMGCAMDVDVGWRQGVADIELTDTSPIITRADLLSGTSDRKALYGEDDGDYYDLIEGQLSGGKYQRLRVVRTLINGVGIDQLGVYNRVLVDRWVEMDQRMYFNEVDVLQNGELDLDWSYLYDEVVNNPAVKAAGIDPTEVTYRIVLGNGSIDTASTNNLFGIATTRHFDVATLRTRPIALSPGNANAVVYDARPTFKWSMGGYNSYTAFQLQVMSGSTVVWDSGVRRAPAADLDGVYTFTADVYAGGTISGMLENNKDYTWRVSMYNAKFKSAFWSEENPTFRMNVPTAGYGYGSIPVCVRYYGPSSWRNQTVLARVEAFETPDFTGIPVARGYAANRGSLANTNKAHTANCTLIGLPKGTYYVRAYLDVFDPKFGGTRFVRDAWESWGYACGREKSPAQPYAAIPIVIDDVNAGMKPVDVYIEDTDINGNALPDLWEVLQGGSASVLEQGVRGSYATLAGTFPSSTALASLPSKAGTTASAIRSYIDQSFASPEMAALVLGLTPQQVTFTATGAVVVESKVAAVEISGVALDDAGNLTIKVDGKLAASADGKGIYEVVAEPTKTVTCSVYAKETLEQADWQFVAEETVTVGGGAATIAVPGAANAKSGFYKAVITE